MHQKQIGTYTKQQNSQKVDPNEALLDEKFKY